MSKYYDFLCKNTDCLYYDDPRFSDKCFDCSENANAKNPETAIFHYEEEERDIDG